MFCFQRITVLLLINGRVTFKITNYELRMIQEYCYNQIKTFLLRNPCVSERLMFTNKVENYENCWSKFVKKIVDSNE